MGNALSSTDIFLIAIFLAKNKLSQEGVCQKHVVKAL
jgi:hypothetical protein